MAYGGRYVLFVLKASAVGESEVLDTRGVINGSMAPHPSVTPRRKNVMYRCDATTVQSPIVKTVKSVAEKIVREGRGESRRSLFSLTCTSIGCSRVEEALSCFHACLCVI